MVTGSPGSDIVWVDLRTGNRTSGNVLNFRSVTRTQNGEYRCEATNECGNDSESVFVIVRYPPNIVTSSVNQTVNESDTVTLDCTADSKPPANITWTRVFDSSSVSFPLTITGKQDEGFYRCTASNGVGSPATKNVFIAVENFHPFETQVMTTLQNNAAVVNDTFSVTCSAEANPPVEYMIYKDDISLINITSHPAVFETSVTERVNQARYKCVPFNSFGPGPEKEITIAVHYPPSIVTTSVNQTVNESDTVTLNCAADGKPPAVNITWTRLFDSSSVSFPLTITGKQDEGFYRCSASNGVGSPVTKDVFIAVENFHPFGTQVMTTLQNNATVVNDTFNVTCTAEANPPAEYMIYKDDISLINITSHPAMLETSVTERVNQARYKCVPFSSFGPGQEKEITIAVHYPPIITSPKKETIALRTGTNVTIPCVATGNPTPDVYWNTASGERSGSNGMLHFYPIRVNDNGSAYVCTADNGIESTAVARVSLVVGDNTTNLKMTFPSESYLNAYQDLQREESKLFAMRIGSALRAVDDNSNLIDTVTVTKLSPGSVNADLYLTFTTIVHLGSFVSALQFASTRGPLGDLVVDSASIQLIQEPVTPLPTGSTHIPTVDPECSCCSCTCNDTALYVVIAVLTVIIAILLIYIILLHGRGAARKETERPHEVSEYAKEVYSNEIVMEELDPGSYQGLNIHQDLLGAQYQTLNRASRSGDTMNERQTMNPSPNVPLSEYHPLNPGTRSFEIPREHVTIEKIIGKGAFGQVAKGTAIDLPKRPGKTDVAIKMLKAGAPETDRKDLLSELNLMKKLKPHPHVIKLLGCVTNTEPLLVLIEYVPYGDLLGYLRKSRGLNDTYFKDPDIKPKTNLTPQQLIKFAWQIADGMSYLSSKSIIHRDLAARNVLVGERETCKVTDFGMARDMHQEDIYQRKTKGRLPVKWTAYEALLYGRYSTKSDVWSFGVVLYEIFTIGGSPYPRMDGRKIAELLQRQYRMPQPKHVDDMLYQIMLQCWQNDPALRPNFEELRDELKHMEKQHKRVINMRMYDNQVYANVEDLAE